MSHQTCLNMSWMSQSLSIVHCHTLYLLWITVLALAAFKRLPHKTAATVTQVHTAMGGLHSSQCPSTVIFHSPQMYCDWAIPRGLDSLFWLGIVLYFRMGPFNNPLEKVSQVWEMTAPCWQWWVNKWMFTASDLHAIVLHHTASKLIIFFPSTTHSHGVGAGVVILHLF